mmetsp:Transcript_6942/g.21983  ORF Transcript_6942/g.21983 Transcript_6942/m.21983 type:complete len:298 (-) Transcript_6942:818-1711(-)
MCRSVPSSVNVCVVRANHVGGGAERPSTLPRRATRERSLRRSPLATRPRVGWSSRPTRRASCAASSNVVPRSPSQQCACASQNKIVYRCSQSCSAARLSLPGRRPSAGAASTTPSPPSESAFPSAAASATAVALHASGASVLDSAPTTSSLAPVPGAANTCRRPCTQRMRPLTRRSRARSSAARTRFTRRRPARTSSPNAINASLDSTVYTKRAPSTTKARRGPCCCALPANMPGKKEDWRRFRSRRCWDDGEPECRPRPGDGTATRGRAISCTTAKSSHSGSRGGGRVCQSTRPLS